MFQAFNVLLTKSEIANLQVDARVNLSSSKSVNETKLRSVLERILASNTISVSEVEATLFPSLSTHVFISHSHADLNDARKFSDFLYSQFSIKSFIDSEFWGNVDTLIESILSPSASRSDIKKYTSNAYMILGMALMKAIDSTECIFFLNTTNSVTLNPETAKMVTRSPWICLELLCTQSLRRVTPARYKKFMAKTESQFDGIELSTEARAKKEFNFFFDIDTNHLTVLKNYDLILWRIRGNFCKTAEKNLDILYLQKEVIKGSLSREVLNG